jgi:integrase
MSKAKRYDNLYRVKWTSNWVFRKYSAAKRAEFCASTGIEATEANAAVAYQEGVKRFDAWLGVHLSPGRSPLIRDIARVVLAGKASKRKATALKARSELENHILPAFGHLRPTQVTSLRLTQYETEARLEGRRSLFNTRKILMEILRRAKDEGLIQALPTWKVSDPEAEPPRFIEAAEFRRIRRLVKGPEKLVLFILYYQGGRPREVLQYRWEMIRWQGERAWISIPGAITKTKRARTIPLNSRVHRMLKRIQKPAGPLFSMKGKPDLSRKVYDRGWFEAMAALGLDYSVYNLRDSYITRKLREGISDVFVAKYVDSSPTEIAKRYAVSTDDVMLRLAG